MTEHTYESWEETYLPVTNYTEHSFDSRMFETYGDDVAFVKSCNNCHVWTLVSTDSGEDVIVEGMRFVNRLGYFVTVRPWSEPVEVTIGSYDSVA